MKYTVKVGQIYDCRGVGVKILAVDDTSALYGHIKDSSKMFIAKRDTFIWVDLIEDVP